MGRRGRQRARTTEDSPEAWTAPDCEYRDAEGDVLVLRGSLSAATRRRYASIAAGGEATAAASLEDTWQRAAELLFEHLAVRWVISDVPVDRPRELLARYRAATSAERARVRVVLREHCAEHFPELKAP